MCMGKKMRKQKQSKQQCDPAQTGEKWTNHSRQLVRALTYEQGKQLACAADMAHTKLPGKTQRSPRQKWKIISIGEQGSGPLPPPDMKKIKLVRLPLLHLLRRWKHTAEATLRPGPLKPGLK